MWSVRCSDSAGVYTSTVYFWPILPERDRQFPTPTVGAIDFAAVAAPHPKLQPERFLTEGDNMGMRRRPDRIADCREFNPSRAAGISLSGARVFTHSIRLIPVQHDENDPASASGQRSDKSLRMAATKAGLSSKVRRRQSAVP